MIGMRTGNLIFSGSEVPKFDGRSKIVSLPSHGDDVTGHRAPCVKQRLTEYECEAELREITGQ